MIRRPVEILLVEDNPGDVRLTRDTLLEGKVPKRIQVVVNGEEAIQSLLRREPFANAPRPDIVLLDLNLPKRDGLEVLRAMKRDENLRSITAIMFTTSKAQEDVNAAYDLNVNCYIVKPMDLEEFIDAIRGIEEFWMSTAALPTNLPPGFERSAEANEKRAGYRDPTRRTPSAFAPRPRSGRVRRAGA